MAGIEEILVIAGILVTKTDGLVGMTTVMLVGSGLKELVPDREVKPLGMSDARASGWVDVVGAGAVLDGAGVLSLPPVIVRTGRLATGEPNGGWLV